MQGDFYRRGTDPRKTAMTTAQRVNVVPGTEFVVLTGNSNRVAVAFTLMNAGTIGAEQFLYIGCMVAGVLMPFASINDGRPSIVITPEEYGPDVLGEIAICAQNSTNLIALWEVSKVQ